MISLPIAGEIGVSDLLLHPNLKTVIISDSNWRINMDSLFGRLVDLIPGWLRPRWSTLLCEFLDLARFPHLRTVAARCQDDVDFQLLQRALPLADAWGVCLK
jgi:hypothetical protein